MRAMRVIMTLAFVFAAACGGSSSTCDLKQPGQAPACTAGVVEDQSASRCQDSTNSPYICRNGLGYCVVCKGTFDDGCQINGTNGNSYCVHGCSGC